MGCRAIEYGMWCILNEHRRGKEGTMKVSRNVLYAALLMSLALTSCGADGDSGDQGSLNQHGAFDATMVEGCIQGDLNPYWGDLHAHTSYSDGELTPADAFAYGRDEGGLDILVITDHLEQLYLPFPALDKWQECRERADEANVPGSFIADCGFEYGSGFSGCFQSTGHNNVFFSDYLFTMIQLNFHEFYQSLVDCPTCIGQFNHPGDPTELNWNGFEYHADVDEKMNLFEFNSPSPWGFFFQALDAGWHISPMYNQDNHDPDWGTKNEHRSGFYLADLTREDLKEAMAARRSFMTTDKNAAIRAMAFGTCWMGSILSGSFPQEIALQVEAFDLDAGDGLNIIEIYGPGEELLDSFDCGETETCQATFTVDASSKKYFVAKASEVDGDWLVAAPVWIVPE